VVERLARRADVWVEFNRSHPAGAGWRLHPPSVHGFSVKRVTGIEPAWPAWKA